MSTESIFQAVGRRKNSTARVRLAPGTGVVKINNRGPEDYFPRETVRRSGNTMSTRMFAAAALPARPARSAWVSPGR